MRHVTHQMTKLVLEHKGACKSRLVLNLSQAKRIERAVRAVIKLYCTDVSCEWVSCLHTPSISWNSFQETEITTIYHHELQLVGHFEFCHCDVEDDAADGFPVALCNRSFLLLRIVDLLVDVVDVLDVSVQEIAAFPPSEHLSFLGIVSVQRQILVAVEEAFEAHQHSNEESNVRRSATVQLS